jgi:hypothetical protein
VAGILALALAPASGIMGWGDVLSSFIGNYGL